MTSTKPHSGTTPFETFSVREGMDGLVGFRPAATFGRTGMDGLLPLIRAAVAAELSKISKEFKVEMSRPGFLELDCQDIEWVTAVIHFGGGGKNGTGEELHRFMVSRPAVHMVAPFDWLAFLRQVAVRIRGAARERSSYYKATGPIMELLGPDACVYLPDDRTLVIDAEDAIRKLAGGETPSMPAFLHGPDWEQASRGLLAIAINNQDGTFAKHYDLGRPDDALVLSVFKGVDRWILGVDDTDTIAVHAAALCRGQDASAAIPSAIDSLRKLGNSAIGHPDLEVLSVAEHELMLRMTKAFLANLRVERTDHSVDVRAAGFGTFADIASIVKAEFREAGSHKPNGGARSNGSKP